MERLGNTTIALGNGFASGAAVLATFSLLVSLVLIAKMNLNFVLNVNKDLLIGVVFGVSMPYIFSGLLLRNLTKMVLDLMQEIMNQFKEVPFLLEDKAKPDIYKAADKNICNCMNALIIPGILMALVPIFIGYILGIKILLGFVLGNFLIGFTQSFSWTNMGDALHNAKYYIANGNFGGKKSPTYENILVADNYGDAFKDLLSPSINILLKSVTIISALIIYFVFITV
jgi:K(+)-stimulated pyrophosphate-energized sodium pump